MKKLGGNVALYAVGFCVLCVAVVFAIYLAGCSAAKGPPYIANDGFLQPYASWPCDGGNR